MKKLDSQLRSRLKLYSLAAGSIAAASSAQAGVTHVDLDTAGGAGDTILVDINNDGTDDFAFIGSYQVFTSSSVFIASINRLFIVPLGSNEVNGSLAGSYMYPYALSTGAPVNCNIPFNGGSNLQTLAWQTYYSGSFFSYGNFTNTNDKYIGVKLDISGETHYGWIRMVSVGASDFHVGDAGVDDTPGMGILAGSTTSADLSVSGLTVTDAGNAGNGADLNVMFDAASDETLVDEYAIFVVKEANAGSFDNASAAAAVSSSNYASAGTSGSSQNVFLSATDVDVDGDLIAANVDYAVFVGAVSCGLVGPMDSAAIKLEWPAGFDDLNGLPFNVYTHAKTLSIRAGEAQIGKGIRVSDILGQEVTTFRLSRSNESKQLDVSAGVYIVSLVGESGIESSQKIIIR